MHCQDFMVRKHLSRRSNTRTSWLKAWWPHASGRNTLIAKHHARQSKALLSSWQSDLSTLGIKSDNQAGAPLPSEKISDLVWQKIAVLHKDECQLDSADQILIVNRNPVAALAARATKSKTETESPLVRLVRDLQGTIAIDTVRNEYLLHLQISTWFAAGQVGEVEALNDRVYAELFSLRRVMIPGWACCRPLTRR